MLGKRKTIPLVPPPSPHVHRWSPYTTSINAPTDSISKVKLQDASFIVLSVFLTSLNYATAMPSQRRSQGPTPCHQPAPPCASLRQRIPPACAAAAAAPRGKGWGVVGASQAPPPANDSPAAGGGGGRGAADIPTPLLLPTMWCRIPDGAARRF
jgi:hypothetical protein